MRSITNRRPVDPEAHTDYLQGRYEWSRDATERAINLFKKAIDKDPAFAPAYAELAIVYFWQAHIGGPSPKEILPLSRAAASKALQLDPDLPEAHFALALLATSAAEADARYKEAPRLNPSYAECYHMYGVMYEGQGRNEEAVTMVRRAIALDPLNNDSQVQLGMIAWTSRNYDQAIAIFENLRERAAFGRSREHTRLGDGFLKHSLHWTSAVLATGASCTADG